MPVGTVKFFNYGKSAGSFSQKTDQRRVRPYSAVEQSGIRTTGRGQRIQFDVEPERRGRKRRSTRSR
jgi:cold shock CspA family protein